MKKTSEKRSKLNRMQKIEVIIATILTIALVVGVSVYAWFESANNMETMTKVKSPDNLDIRAGDFHPILNFDLNGINIEEMAEEGKAEYRVFSVSAGDYKIAYNLQIAHTTNIPFKYSLYMATRMPDGTTQTEDNAYVEYHPLSDTEAKSYYQISDTAIELKTLNPDEVNETAYGRTLANKTGNLYGKTYNRSADTPEIYAVPIYMQTKEPITPTNKEGNDHD